MQRLFDLRQWRPLAIIALLTILMTLTLIGCGGAPAPPTPTALPPTNAPLLTDTPFPTPTPSPPPTSTPTETPPPTPTETPMSGFIVLELTSPVTAGGSATLTIQTVPGAACHLAYVTPSGTESSAGGLGAQIADADGICSWTWRIGSSTRAGTGTLHITADDVAESHPIEIE